MKLDQYRRRKALIKKAKIVVVSVLAITIPIATIAGQYDLSKIGVLASKSVDFLANTALFSAGLTMPEGGIRAVQANIDEITLDAGDKAYLNLKQMASGETLVAFFKSENEETHGYHENSDKDSQTDSSSSSSGSSESSSASSSSESNPSETPDDASPNTSENTLKSLYIKQNISDFISNVDYKAVGNKSGSIKNQQFSSKESGTILKLERGGFIRNATELKKDEVEKIISQSPKIKIEKNTEPQVLIMHTHTTEAYEPYSRDYFDKDYYDRTQDSNKNVVAVGNKIALELEKAGIGVIQDGTLHDYPSYNGSYSRSEKTINEILKKYPSIKVVIDVHRDAIVQSDGARIAPVAKINGKEAAQVMIISGCDDGTMNMPNYAENLKLASLFQQDMESEYPGLTRAVLFDYRKYNQHLTTGSLLFEVGSHANSLEQALYSGELVGKALAKTLTSLT